MRSHLTDLLELALPHRCAGCRVPGTRLCPECGLQGRPLLLRDVRGLRVAAAGAYGGGLRTALLAYKERNRRDLAAPLGHLLERAVRAFGPGPLTLVPVPSARSVARVRGGDHVLRLAAVAADADGYELRCALRLARPVLDSAGLDSIQRADNLDGAMIAAQLRPGDPIASVVVVDDIVTTGATVHEGVRALADAGWPVVGAAVVSSTVKHVRAPGISARPP